ncbi:MAG: Pr6Pr family membrane protein [Arachnia sp.]
MKQTWARSWHLVTLVVVVATLLLQLGLVIQGQSVLDESDVPPLATRVWRLVSYFTIQSNVLVAVAAATLVRRPDRDGPIWRVLRIDAVLGITLTGLIHFFLLRPLLDLHGLNAVADTGLHLVVPALALIGWLAFGPRPRLTVTVVLWSLVWPVAWLGLTLLAGVVTGWYPYPFLDVAAHGLGPVLVTCAGVTVLFLLLAAIARLVDARLPRAPLA